MAGLISKSTVERIRQSADIVSIINDYTNLQQRGGQYWGCCPFHNEKTPSFTVDPVKNFYHCFGCGVGGDVVKFVMEMEKLSYPEALTELAKKYNVEIVYENGSAPREEKKDLETPQILELYERIAGTFNYLLMESEQGRKGLEYIKGRGLTDETIRKFKLGYAPAERRWLKGFLKGKNYSDSFLAKTGLFSKNYPDFCLFSDRLMFPIFDRKGSVVAFSGRTLCGDERKYFNSQELPFFKKRETLFAFNFAKKAIRENKAAVICEGNMDVIAYHQSGVEYAVASLGTSFTEEHVRILKAFADTILLSFDSDAAGQKETEKAILMCRKAGLTVKVIRLEGGKDPAEIMLKFGAEILTKQVKNAILDSDYLLAKFKEQFPSESPEDKTRAALAFFPYVDSLQNEMQRESSLELLAHAFNLSPEAVKQDFHNRSQAQSRLEKLSRQPEVSARRPARVNAEQRAVLAVISNPEEFKKMRTELSSDDFEDPLAKDLFINLEECYKQGDFSFVSVLERCSGDVQSLIAEISASGEFSKGENQTEGEFRELINRIVDDSIRLLKRNRLLRQREQLNARLREFKPATADDEGYQKSLVSEIMRLDKEIQAQKK